MSVSYKLRQYMSGVLLLLLASFIMASISYIAGIIPETTIPLTDTNTSTYSKAIFVAENSQYSGSYLGTYFYTFNAPAPPEGKVYLIVVNKNVSTVYVYTNPSDAVGSRVALTAYRNNTHTFATWSNAIPGVGICCSVTATIRLYLIDPNTPMPPPPEIFDNSTTTTTPPAPTISNKLILNFISWVAGIVLVLEALRRFDLEI